MAASARVLLLTSRVRGALSVSVCVLCGISCSDNTFGPAEKHDGSGGSETPDGGGEGGETDAAVICKSRDSSCEFSAECCEAYRCRDGRCQLPIPDCETDTDCPSGRVCRSGDCEVPDCTMDKDCPGGEVCTSGSCTPPEICEDDDPSLAGPWLLDSTLYMGDGINGFVDVVLTVADDLGSYLCPLVPPWACSVIRLLGDLNDMLSVMYVNQLITLTPTGVGTYAGTEEWVAVGFVLDGVYYEGTPADVYAWEIEADPFTAHTCAGALIIDSHRVRMNFCNIVWWAIDATVWIGSDETYSSLGEMVYDLCDDLEFPFNLACSAFVAGILDDLIGCGGLDLLQFDYSGNAGIASDELVYDGVWSGELDPGDDFPGDFTGEKLE